MIMNNNKAPVKTYSMFRNKKPFAAILLIFILLLTEKTFAQETQKAAASSNNWLEILMVIVAAILALVIWGMGQILIATGRQMLDKKRNADKILGIALLIGATFISGNASAQDAAPVSLSANYGGMDASSFWLLVSVIITELAVIFFMQFSIRRIMAELLPEKENKKLASFKLWWAGFDKKFMTKAIPVEREADVMLDHDYDGIRELDNALPPWWKFGFIATIFIAVFYMFYFHVSGAGKNPTEEYAEEVEKAAIAKEIYEASNADKVDEKNIKMPGAAGLSDAKEIFTSVCAACHGKQGEGGAGPNLTDDYWLHKGSLTDIYFSIKHGYPDKGIQSWEKNYSPKEINSLAGYIKTLGGTKPANPKAPQGDLYVASDSAKAIAQTN